MNHSSMDKQLRRSQDTALRCPSGKDGRESGDHRCLIKTFSGVSATIFLSVTRLSYISFVMKKSNWDWICCIIAIVHACHMTPPEVGVIAP